MATASLRARLSAIPVPLRLILLAGVLLSLGWNIATPPFQGPDEAKHFAYIQYLAENGRLPTVTSGTEATEPDLGSTEERDALTVLDLRALIGNRTERPAWSGVDLGLWHAVERSMGHGSRANGNGPNTIAKNPPLYYAVMALPYRAFIWLPLLKRAFVLRLFNTLLYLLTIALVWMIAGEVFSRVRWQQALAAGAVALEPQLAQVGATINADNLLIALTSAFLLCSVRLVKHGPSLGRVIAPSVLAAAAVLTHGRGLVTLPVLAVALVVAWITHRPAARGTLAMGAAALAPVLVAFLAYASFGKGASHSSLYGGQVSELNTKATFKLGQFISTVEQFYLPKLPGLPARIGPHYGYRQVFIEGFYGQGLVVPALFDLLQAATAVGLIGLCVAVVRRREQLLRAWPVALVMAALALTTIVFLHYVSYRALLGTGGKQTLIVGRYLLPMVALFGLAIAFTVSSLPRRMAALTGAAVLSSGVVLVIARLTSNIYRFYA